MDAIIVKVTKCAVCGCPFSAISEDAIKAALKDHYHRLHGDIVLAWVASEARDLSEMKATK